MKKKITAFLMTASFLASNTVFGKDTEKEFSKNTEILSAFNIIELSDDLQQDAYVTRGEFAKYLSSAMQIMPDNKTGFTDVFDEHLKAVSALEKYNIVYGNGNEFRPDDMITTCDAAVMIMRALGYEQLAQMSGGYPGGYLSLAESEGIFDGIDTAIYDYATSETIMRMLCNMLEANIYVVELSGSKTTYEQGKTFMEQYYEAYETTGILQGNNELNINGSQAARNKDSVVLDYNEYTSKIDLSEYLGYNLKIYYTSTDGENTIIYAEEAKKNKAEVVSGYDIENFDLNNYVLEYENETKMKKLKFYNGTTFILNGEFVTDIDNTEIIPKDGKVKAVDNNGDGKIDVFFINKYEYAVAGSISLNKEFIIDDITNKKIMLDDDDVKITKDGEKIDLKDITEDSLLEMMYGKNGEIKEIHVYEKNTGICSGFGYEDVAIDGEKSDFSKFYLEKKEAKKTEDIVVGNAVTYWKNSAGRIVWLTCDTNEKLVYAYLIRAYMDDDGERGIFKVFASNGEVERITAAEKIKLNEIKVDGADVTKRSEFLDDYGNTKRQLIMYSKNSRGEMNRLFTARDTLQDAVSGGADKDFAESYGDVETIFKNKDKFSIDYYTESKIRYVKGQFYSTYGITEETTIFNVPDPSVANVSDDDFYIGETSQFRSDELYGDLYFYDFNENLNAACLVHYGSKTENIGSTLLVVDSVNLAIDDDNEIKPCITGYQNGKLVEYMGEDAEYLSRDSEWGTLVGKNYANIGWQNLKKGDILFIGFNKDNEINAYKVIAHDVKNLKTDYMLGGYSNIMVIDGRDSYGGSQFCTGVVSKTEKGYFFVRTKTTTGVEVIRRLKAAGGVYSLQKKKLTLASFDDISVGDRVAVKCSFDIPAETIIVEE